MSSKMRTQKTHNPCLIMKLYTYKRGQAWNAQNQTDTQNERWGVHEIMIFGTMKCTSTTVIFP